MNGFRLAEAPFSRLVIPFAIGAASATYSPWTRQALFVSLTLTVIVASAVVLLHACYGQLNLHRRKWVPGMLLQMTMLFGAFCFTLCRQGVLAGAAPPHVKAFVVEVASEPIVGPSTTRFVGKVIGAVSGTGWLPWAHKLAITVMRDTTPSAFAPVYGDTILASPNIQPVQHALNPAEFDYGRYLWLQGMRNQGFFMPGQVRFISHGPVTVTGLALAFRRKLVDKYSTYIRDRDAAALLSALIVGYRADLDASTVAVYSNTGTTHVLSVSGMHVGIVFIVIVFLLKFMDRNRGLRVARAVLIIILIIGYSVLTGLSSAVCRAAVMLILLIVAKALGREISNFNVLAASAWILLLYEPAFIADAGFQLSYLAVWGLFYIYPVIYQLFATKSWLLDKLWASVAVSLAAQLATFPLSLYYFHQFPVYFLLSNLFILLPVTAIMYLGIVFLFVPFHPLLSIMGVGLEKLVHFMNGGLDGIAKLPGAVLPDNWPTVIEMSLLYMVLVALVSSLVAHNRRLVYVAAGAALLLGVSNVIKRVDRFDRRQFVVFSLKRHTALGFVDRDGFFLVSDLPASDKVIRRSVIPYFSFCGNGSPQAFTFDAPLSGNSLHCRDDFLWHNGTTVFVPSGDFARRRYSAKIRVDYIVLRNNYRIRLENLLSKVASDHIIIDGSNSAYAVDRWLEQAAEQAVRCIVVRENPAFIADL